MRLKRDRKRNADGGRNEAGVGGGGRNPACLDPGVLEGGVGGLPIISEGGIVGPQHPPEPRSIRLLLMDAVLKLLSLSFIKQTSLQETTFPPSVSKAG